eukprot:1186756-Prorocentrum_minimum.AAC.1
MTDREVRPGNVAQVWRVCPPRVRFGCNPFGCVRLECGSGVSASGAARVCPPRVCPPRVLL